MPMLHIFLELIIPERLDNDVIDLWEIFRSRMAQNANSSLSLSV